MTTGHGTRRPTGETGWNTRRGTDKGTKTQTPLRGQGRARGERRDEEKSEGAPERERERERPDMLGNMGTEKGNKTQGLTLRGGHRTNTQGEPKTYKKQT